MILRISHSFNNERPSGKLSFNILYNVRTDMTIEGKWKLDTIYEQKKKLGLCYKYREKFVPNHQCNKKNLNIINGANEEGDEFLEVKKGNGNEIIANKHQKDEYDLSLNTFVDSCAHNTIRIKKNYQNKNLLILVDNNSTRNFIDKYVVNEIINTIEKTIVLVVTITNESVMMCSVFCPRF